MTAISIGDLEILEREWPKGCRLFTVEGRNFHMSFADDTEADEIPAILLRFKSETVVEILELGIFDTTEDALKWMVERMPKWCSN